MVDGSLSRPDQPNASRPCIRPVPRIAFDAPDLQDKLREYEENGIPLIIEGFHKHPRWPSDMLNDNWFLQHGQQELDVRDVSTGVDSSIPTAEFIEYCHTRTPRDDGSGRMYAKDAQCPDAWRSWLAQSGIVPSGLTPLNDQDLLSCLPPIIRPETLMCYLGIDGTFTPCHKDLCASSGQNLMVFTESDSHASWFMTKSSDAPAISDYFRDELGRILDWESHAVTEDEIAAVGVEIYTCSQALGDLVLVPPRSCHQVANYGGLTIKLSWSRMTLRGAIMAAYHELPLYRRVCRREVYRIKSMLWHSLTRTTSLVEVALSNGVEDLRSLEQLAILVPAVHAILVDEFYPSQYEFPSVSTAGDEQDMDSIVCDYCGSDVFIGFFECIACRGPGEPLEAAEDIQMCPGCVAEGRTCKCGKSMKAMQRFPFRIVLQSYNKAVRTLKMTGVDCRLRELGENEPPFCKDGREVGLFRAAVVVTGWVRRDDNGLRTCNIRKSVEQHAVLSYECIRCVGCHSSLCLKHWAQRTLHASEIVPILARGERNSKHWHRAHMSLCAIGKQSRKRVADSETSGGPIEPMDLPIKLALLACAYPYAHAHKRSLNSGFYDYIAEP